MMRSLTPRFKTTIDRINLRDSLSSFKRRERLVLAWLRGRCQAADSRLAIRPRYLVEYQFPSPTQRTFPCLKPRLSTDPDFILTETSSTLPMLGLRRAKGSERLMTRKYFLSSYLESGLERIANNFCSGQGDTRKWGSLRRNGDWLGLKVQSDEGEK